MSEKRDLKRRLCESVGPCQMLSYYYMPQRKSETSLFSCVGLGSRSRYCYGILAEWKHSLPSSALSSARGIAQSQSMSSSARLRFGCRWRPKGSSTSNRLFTDSSLKIIERHSKTTQFLKRALESARKTRATSDRKTIATKEESSESVEANLVLEWEQNLKGSIHSPSNSLRRA